MQIRSDKTLTREQKHCLSDHELSRLAIHRLESSAHKVEIPAYYDIYVYTCVCVCVCVCARARALALVHV
jgi:hypothetical protein